MKVDIQKVIQIASNNLNPSDMEFFERVWSTRDHVYSDRLKALGFMGKDHILDAGCGVGQWTIAMAEFNHKVHAIDIDSGRAKTVSEIATLLQISNIETAIGSLEDLPYDDYSFDAIFSYSAIYFTDYRQSLKEFYRVLKPGGSVYINSNSIGWYIYNIRESHNSSANYDSSKMAMETLNNTLDYYYSGQRPEGRPVAIPSRFMEDEMSSLGFKDIKVDGDGLIRVKKNIQTKSFYPKKYYDQEGVYEIFASKD